MYIIVIIIIIVVIYTSSFLTQSMHVTVMHRLT